MSPSGKPHRVCACGCNRSLEGRPIYQKWHVNVACQRVRQKTAREKQHAKHGNVYKSRQGTVRVYERKPNAPPREAEILCKCCYGVEDARSPHRMDDRGSPVGEWSGRGWRCRLCHEPWRAPEPIHAVGAIRSSAGTCADHGKMYGFAGNEDLGLRTP